MLRLCRQNLLNNKSAYLVNLHPKTTHSDIQNHPAFKNLKNVTFVQEKTIKRMDWGTPEKFVVSKDAVLEFKSPESKTKALQESFLLLGNGLSETYIPISSHDTKIKSSRLPQLKPHRPRDMAIIEGLPSNTTKEDIKSLKISGLVDIKLIDRKEQFGVRHSNNSDKLVYLYFESSKLARNFEQMTYEENIFDDEFTIKGRRVKCTNAKNYTVTVGKNRKKKSTVPQGLVYSKQKISSY